jgi:tetratricopeptide (TPR) repeat protein
VKQPKIVLNMIVRDCADFIEKTLDSVAGHVDYYVIGLGGKSKDNTESVIRNWLQSRVNNDGSNWLILPLEWEDDFGKARNQVLEVTKEKFPDSDYLFWIDSDDVLKAKTSLHNIAFQIGAGAIQFPYWYQLDDNGRPIVWHSRERLVNLSLQWQWIRPIHETLFTPTPHNIVQTDDAIIVHDVDQNAEARSTRNEAILFKWLEKAPEDKRTKLYIAHMFYSRQEWDEAARWFGAYFNDPDNPVEQWSAAVFAGRCRFADEKFEEAIGWFYEAINLEPEWLDPWVGLGNSHVMLGNHSQALGFYKTADTKSKSPSLLFIVENEYTWNRYCYEHQALATEGRFEEAMAVVKKALQINPKHLGFEYFRLGYREAIESEKATESLKFLCLYMLRRGDGLSALELLRSAPTPVEEEPEIKQLENFIRGSISQVWDKEELKHMSKVGNEAGGESNKDIEFSCNSIEWLLTGEERVKEVLKLLKKHKERMPEGAKFRVVDLACAGGNIAIAIAQELDAYVTAID